MSFTRVLIFSILLIINNASNKTVICDIQNKCTDVPISCDSTDPNCDLHVQCTGGTTNDERKSCAGSIINCTLANSCTLDCTGESSCDSVQVFCPSNAICNINCISQLHDTCTDISVHSATNTTTNIKCRGTDACLKAQIDCAESIECNLACYGENACGDFFNITAQKSKLLNISQCGGPGSGPFPCKDLNVYCPPNDNNQARCFLPGEGIFYEEDQSTHKKSGGIHIYAIHAFEDLNVAHYNADNFILGSMSCTDNYEHSCNITNNITNNRWDCIDNTLCSTKVYQRPTVEPTIIPTIQPTSDPTIEPTIYPTINPTVDPTYIPTIIPTINPTTEPTSSPTIEPTTEPTLSPTIDPTESTVTPTIYPTTVPTYNPTQSPTVAMITKRGAQYGLFIGAVICILFVCIMCFAWRYWSKGNDIESIVHVNERRKMKRNRGKKKRRSDDKKMQLNAGESDEFDDGLTMGGGLIGNGDSSDLSNDDDLDANTSIYNNGNKQKITPKYNDSTAAVEIAVDGGVKKKKKKKKKKKEKKKKKKKKKKKNTNDTDNAGHYQKQTDNPFAINTWTELTEFD